MVAVDGGVGRVMREQPGVAVTPLERLDRGLVIEQRRDDLAVVGSRLTAYDDPIAITDGRVDHRLADHLEQEELALADDLARAMGAADADETVRAVVVTGAGRAFCAGADLSGGEGGFAPGDKRADDSPRLMPHKVRKPVIAAINGHAVGVGITYPMLCDIRIAAEEAKIQFAMVRRGILPELGSHVILPRVVGFSRAAELLLPGKLMTGAEAAEIGVVSRALPAADVLPAALEIARSAVPPAR